MTTIEILERNTLIDAMIATQAAQLVAWDAYCAAESAQDVADAQRIYEMACADAREVSHLARAWQFRVM